jgi:MoaA/NifB/PqqE/SkfB family radical SAM enzyme
VHLPEANRALNVAEIRAGLTTLQSTPLQMNVELTGICNINPPCVFCSGKNFGHNYPPMDAAYLQRYEAFLEHCERVNEDSFGEPLSHPGVLDVARRFSGRGQRFSLVSNGLLLSPRVAEAFARIGPDLGLHVSFNAATAQTFYRLTGRSFDRVVDNVRGFVQVYRARNGTPPDLTLTFIVMRMNRDEVRDFLHLARDLGTAALLAPLHDRPSKPLGRFGYDFVYEDEMLPYEELRAIGDMAQSEARRLGVPLHLQWDATADSALRGFAEPGVSIPCLIPWRYLHIQQHSQKVYACPYHKRPVGDLARDAVADIWNGEEVRELRTSLASGKIPQFCWNNSASCPLVMQARHESVDAEVSGDIIMGGNDHWHVDAGWHTVEEVPERVRWTTRRAAFRIAIGSHTSLCIRCQSFKPHLDREPVRGHLEIAGAVVGLICLARTGWQEFRWTLAPGHDPAGSGRAKVGVVRAAIVIDNPWVPAHVLESSTCEPVIGVPRHTTGSLDTRELGIVVQRIWVESVMKEHR